MSSIGFIFIGMFIGIAIDDSIKSMKENRRRKKLIDNLKLLIDKISDRNNTVSSEFVDDRE